ncbi:hypothetical protein FBUS_03784 [Fasciolopsis buskii]|uniref:Tetraspanin n=1 Tax=Fasciolopsis buskii TaxID=27845 RepID=A0A8E0RW91_9TREM|nr:hypothetical protein FBUS_03784 [Fasciolopsis buski]
MAVRKVPVQSAFGISLKYGLLVHHSLFLIIACVFLGFGSWLLLWTDGYAQWGIITQTYYYASGRVLLMLASLLSIFAFTFGCCALNSELPSLILTQISVIFVLLGIFLGTTVCGFQTVVELRRTLPHRFAVAVTKYYGINLDRPRNQELTNAIDSIQIYFECCGVAGTRDSNGSWFMYRSKSSWYYLSRKTNSIEAPPYVPDSCCVFRSQDKSFTSYEESRTSYDTIVDRTACVGEKSASVSGTTAPSSPNPAKVDNSNKYIHEKGCITMAYVSYKYYALLVAGLGLVGVVFCIIGLILNCLLLWCIEYEQCIRLLNEQEPTYTRSLTDFHSINKETKSSVIALTKISPDQSQYAYQTRL